MGPLPDIRVVYEQWDTQGQMREIAKLKAEMHVLATYTTEMAKKHNALFEDTSNAMQVVEEVFLYDFRTSALRLDPRCHRGHGIQKSSFW